MANTIYAHAVVLFGEESQMLQTMEECAELIQALSHKMRGRDHNVEEEIADVEIMIAQMRLMFDEDKIEEFKREKITRLDNLIDSFAERIGAGK